MIASFASLNSRLPSRSVAILLLAMVTPAFAGCQNSTDIDSSWLGTIVGVVEGDDVGPEIGLSSRGALRACEGPGDSSGFAVHPDEQGRFRIGLTAFNLGPSPRCFDMVVDRDGTPVDTLHNLGPANMFDGPPLDSLYLRIRVFGADSAVVLESYTLPAGGGS